MFPPPGHHANKRFRAVELPVAAGSRTHSSGHPTPGTKEVSTCCNQRRRQTEMCSGVPGLLDRTTERPAVTATELTWTKGRLGLDGGNPVQAVSSPSEGPLISCR